MTAHVPQESSLELPPGKTRADYHPLALDADGVGLWGWIDRRGEQLADWLNPILIKEARQSLKSRQFLVTFFVLLATSCLWTVLGVVLNAPDVYYVPSGTSLMSGYYFILAIPLIGIVPLAAFRSLATEIDDDTFEMLVITKLSAIRIVLGKLNSAMLQMMIYFAAIVPCLAFSYLLRGVNLPTIAMMLVIIFLTAIITTTAALLLASLAPNRAAQTFALLFVLGLILFAQILCASSCLGAVLTADLGIDSNANLFMIITTVIGLSTCWIFIKAAAARIAPVSENRSTGLRWCMFVQSLLWIASIASISLWYDDGAPADFGMMILFFYWMFVGTLMLSESTELSPRVRRDLPSTSAGRALLTWFNPGPSTGYVFAVVTGTIGIGALAACGTAFVTNKSSETHPLIFSMIAAGYLMVYLGIVRLVVLLLTRRLSNSLTLVLVIAGLTMFAAMVTPTILWVISTGSPPMVYEPLEAIDWMWTFEEAFDSAYDPTLAFAILVVGVSITLLNLLLLFRVFEYRRIHVPDRVKQDDAVVS